jgi:hypothetical protein
MKTFLGVVATLVYCTSLSADVTIERSHTHGNAGDPLRTFFSEARVMAENRVRNLKTCDFKKSVNEAKAKWLVSIKDQLADDIKKTKHVWLSDFQGSCAFTQFDVKASPVYLSYPECRTIDGNHQDAMELLIHESLHHLGVETEVDAEEYAAMVMDADELDECPVEPYDPFSEKTCEGAKISNADILSNFQPGSNKSSTIGKSSAQARYRKCNALTGCADWISRKTIFEWKWSASSDSAKTVMNESSFDKDFTFHISDYAAPNYSLRWGVNNFSCMITPKIQNKDHFICNPHYTKTVGRYNRSFYPTDPHTKRFMNFRKNDSQHKQISKFNKSCFYMKSKTIGDKKTNGDYFESEVVIFSKF